MVSLHCTVAERGGVSLVECRVRNDAAVARRVRVASRLDGPVWPPRREGVPEAGWDDGGYEGTVGAGETVPLGFASPAPPADPPAEVAWSERSAAGSGVHPAPRPGSDERAAGGPGAGPTESGPGPDGTTPADVLRALGDPRPPADAVPLADPDGSGDAGPDGDHPDSGSDDRAADDSGRESTVPTDDGSGPPSDGAPDAVEAWLVGVAARVERAETLATADGVTEAARGLEAVGGLDGAEVLVAQLAADARRLREVAARAGDLAGRAEAAADAPVATLRRLA